MKKLFPKSLAVIMITAMLLCVIAFTAAAETYSGTCGANLTWTFDTESGKLEISGSGAMYNYATPNYVNSMPWKSYLEDIESIIISDGVTTIGDNAFNSCSKLTEITIPTAITSVGKSAFANCTLLETVYFNAQMCSSFGNTSNRVFSGCSNLKNVIFADNVVSVPSYSFDNCAALTNVTMSDSIQVIGEYAFRNCDNIASIELPLNLDLIVNMAFYSCDGLKEIDLNAIECQLFGSKIFGECTNTITVNVGDEVKNIPAKIFAFCPGIETVNIGENVETIGIDAFYYCSNLKTINFVEDGKLKIIDDGAFSCCESLETVMLPESVERVEAYAFYRCTNLSNLGLGNVQFLGHCSFGDCINLKEVVIPNTLTKAETAHHTESGTIILNDAGFEEYYCSPFYDNYYENEYCLQSIEFEDGLEVIPSYICAYTNVKTATIPTSVKIVDEHAFSKCCLNDVYYSGTQENWNKIEIRTDNGNLGTVLKLPLSISFSVPSTTTINYGDTLVLHADLGETALPEGYSIFWTVEGSGVSIQPSEDGLTCNVTSVQSGNVTVKATVVDENGEAVTDTNGNEATAEQQLTSNASFWQKIVSFFKNLFRISRMIIQSV